MSTGCDRPQIARVKRAYAGFLRLVPTALAVTLFPLAWLVASTSHSPGIPKGVRAAEPVETSSSIPVGTVLPVRIESTIAIKDVQPGQVVEAKIAQEVPLPNREKIRDKSAVRGSIATVEKDTDGAGVRVTLKFSQMEDRKEALTMTTSLRAIASFSAVRSAQTPLTGPDSGTPSGWADTVQIGGDIRFGDGGTVRNRAKQKVGKGVIGGVLVHLRANPALGCDGPVNGDDHLQALWVFSADACGAYGLKGTEIRHTGKSEPVGEITLHFDKDDMKLEGGTAMLLRVVARP